MNRFLPRVAQRLRALRPHRRLGALAFLLVLVGAAACSENLESGKACTDLCPLANETLRDTVFDPVAFDTTLSGFPLAGTTRPLLLATAPDSLDVRAVVRFDSLPSKYAPPAGGDSLAIATVDDTFIRLYLDTTLVPTASGTATLEAYDVDTPSPTDTATSTLAGLFTPDRLLGSTTLTFTAKQAVADSLHLHLNDAVFAAKARAGARLRVGLRLTSTARAQVRVLGALNGTALSTSAPQLSFDAAGDTIYKAVAVSPYSVISTGQSSTEPSAAVDQSLVVKSPPGATNGDLLVGGAPGQRALIRFNLPVRLTDSTDIVRAVLELTQLRAPGAAATDTVRLRSEAVLATTAVSDPTQAALLAAPSGFSADTLKLSPADSGVQQLSLVTLIRAYRSLPSNTTRAISIRSLHEGAEAGQVRFFSAAAPAAVRPRLRLTYIPRTSFGIP